MESNLLLHLPFHIPDIGHWSGKPKAGRAAVQSECDSGLRIAGRLAGALGGVSRVFTGLSSGMSGSQAPGLSSQDSVMACFMFGNGGVHACRTELRDKQFLVWISYLNPLIWISLVQNFLFRGADLWLLVCPLSPLYTQISGMFRQTSYERKTNSIGAFSVQWSITQEAGSKGNYGWKRL